jgi:hypothetical protein
VVLKALAKRREARYQSAEEMAGALRQAATKAGIRLPTRVSLPLSFTTAEAPSESVAVLSGTARERVQDAEFATQDTEARLGEQLAAEAAAQQAAPDAGQEAVLSARLSVRAPEVAAQGKRRSLPRTFLSAVSLVVVGNLVLVLVGLVTGWWGIFGRGWPFELLLLGLALSMIMDATGIIWLLIPTAIVLGNGYLMSFYAITNAWHLWAILWPLEPLLIVGAVLWTIRLADQGDRAREVSHRLAQAVIRPTAIALILVVVLGAILG